MGGVVRFGSILTIPWSLPCSRVAHHGRHCNYYDIISNFVPNNWTLFKQMWCIQMSEASMRDSHRRNMKTYFIQPLKSSGLFVMTANITLIHQAAKLQFPTSLSAGGSQRFKPTWSCEAHRGTFKGLTQLSQAYTFVPCLSSSSGIKTWWLDLQESVCDLEDRNFFLMVMKQKEPRFLVPLQSYHTSPRVPIFQIILREMTINPPSIYAMLELSLLICLLLSAKCTSVLIKWPWRLPS